MEIGMLGLIDILIVQQKLKHIEHHFLSNYLQSREKQNIENETTFWNDLEHSHVIHIDIPFYD